MSKPCYTSSELEETGLEEDDTSDGTGWEEIAATGDLRGGAKARKSGRRVTCVYGYKAIASSELR